MCKGKKFKTASSKLENITETILNKKDICKVPCKVTYLTLNDLPSPDNHNKTRTFTYKINSASTLTQSDLIYTFWSYIGEFGGWVGLFIGVCLIDLYDLFISSLQHLINIAKN